MYTSCKPTLVWPRPFVNTCLLVLLLIRHTHKYWSLQIFDIVPIARTATLKKYGVMQKNIACPALSVLWNHPPPPPRPPLPHCLCMLILAGCSCLRGIAWSFIINSRLSNQTMNRLLKIDDYIEVHMSKKAFIQCPTLHVGGDSTWWIWHYTPDLSWKWNNYALNAWLVVCIYTDS